MEKRWILFLKILILSALSAPQTATLCGDKQRWPKQEQCYLLLQEGATTTACIWRTQAKAREGMGKLYGGQRGRSVLMGGGCCEEAGGELTSREAEQGKNKKKWARTPSSTRKQGSAQKMMRTRQKDIGARQKFPHWPILAWFEH